MEELRKNWRKPGEDLGKHREKLEKNWKDLEVPVKQWKNEIASVKLEIEKFPRMKKMQLLRLLGAHGQKNPFELEISLTSSEINFEPEAKNRSPIFGYFVC